jgi:mono/diheme cytochrome c family protein
MPRYSGYDAARLRAVLDTTASLATVPGSRAAWKRGPGSAEAGQRIFAKSCAGCHGDRGQGNTGPGLGTPGFQKAATEEFIAATVARGRAGTPMPAFGRDSASYARLSAQEILDVAAFVRGGLSAQPAAKDTLARR